MNFYLYKLEATYDGELYTYFGSRKSKHSPERDPYTGSPSTKQGRLVFKNPEVQVQKTILSSSFASYDELLVAEKKLIEEHYHEPNNLNFSKNPFNFVDSNKKPKTSMHRKKLAEAKIGSLNHQFGKKHSDETKELMSRSLKGRSPYNKGRVLGEYSEDRRKKMAEGQRSKPKLTCPHCFKIGAENNMNRYHFSNCKLTKGEKS